MVVALVVANLLVAVDVCVNTSHRLAKTNLPQRMLRTRDLLMAFSWLDDLITTIDDLKTKGLPGSWTSLRHLLLLLCT